MDEDDSLKLLVAQRKKRAAFSRMISWEISRTSAIRRDSVDAPEGGNQKGEDSDDSQDTDSISWSSDDSEYFSAEDDVNLSLASSVTDDDSVSQTTSLSCVSDETDSVTDGFQACQVQHVRKRHLSKKQKKKQRDKNRQMLINFADYDVPFRNVEDLEFEILDFMESNSDISRSRIKRMPTLFHLCLQVVSSKGSSRSAPVPTGNLPHLVKGVVRDARRNRSFASVQLSWLYRLLGLVEKYYNLHFIFFEEDNDTIISRKELETRSIWNVNDTDHSGCFIGGYEAAIMLYSYLGHYESGNYRRIEWHNRFCLLVVVASVVDFMLPQHLSAGRLRHSSQSCSSEVELFHKTTLETVAQVKYALTKRYPKIVTYYFDVAVPYALWARGSLTLAGELFVKLAQKQKGRERAMFLCEAARMFAQNEEVDKARVLYMEASDIVLPKARAAQQEKDVLQQKFMLFACLHDQGVMTELKAGNASQAWKTAVKYSVPGCPWSAPLRAVESFLSFHGGSCRETSEERLQSAVKMIEDWCNTCEILLMYLSFVKALLGMGSASKSAMRAFTGSASVVLNLVRYPDTSREQKLKYWQTIVDHVEVHGPPKILKVIWRTQLGHPRIVNDSHLYEADLVSDADLRLALTDEGYLSADAQMMLPPIRAINLDPYTGLHLHTSGQTHLWHTLTGAADVNKTELTSQFLVPTMVEMYSDPEGRTVQYFSAADTRLKTDRYYSTQINMYWSNADGDEARLNLMKPIREAVKQRTFEKLEEEALLKSGKKSTWLHEMKLTTEFCFNKGYNLALKSVYNVRHHMWKQVKQANSKYMKRNLEQETEEKETNVKAGKKMKKKKKECDDYTPLDFGLFLVEYYAYQDTLFLAFGIFPNHDWDAHIFVFLDCTSKASFLKPEVRLVNLSIGSVLALKSDGRDLKEWTSADMDKMVKPPLLRDEIMWRRHNRDSITIYGKKGKVEKTLESQECEDHVLHVYGNKLYSTSWSFRFVCCNPVSDEKFESEELSSVKDLKFAGGKVLAVTETGVYFLHRDTLKKVSIKLPDECKELKLKSEDEYMLTYPAESVIRVLEERKGEEGIYHVALGINNLVIFMDFSKDQVAVTLVVKVAGHPKELKTINVCAGFLLTASIHENGGNFYREHLYHYSPGGQLLGILPFLGPGSRSFSVEALPDPDDSDGKKQIYVFMRDGHEGIIGVQL